MRLPLITGVIALAAVFGVGLYVSDFTVYMGDDPTACNNCHVMDAAYEGWYHAGHQAWAACNDCHTPHAFIPKYIVKGLNGYHHVSAFTLGRIPEAIRATPRQREIVQTVSAVADGQMDAGRFCFECHRSAAHGERGVSILPYQDKGER
jgi:cytochrome c nitrite reductase small subunit